ncbi:hypothetical protein CgunFtcFv8_012190 [Champsocephalus gunnari]|uniref:Uncharacterized protein n=1 Tax=Champsocephalus gunnari TaxID=52237 RepID=A0AAN8HJ58_CHAGU|nr:hypothetical protein CgunFtcFv8_012190 [Champsocephalus gunnari]
MKEVFEAGKGGMKEVLEAGKGGMKRVGKRYKRKHINPSLSTCASLAISKPRLIRQALNSSAPKVPE